MRWLKVSCGIKSNYGECVIAYKNIDKPDNINTFYNKRRGICVICKDDVCAISEKNYYTICYCNYFEFNIGMII